MVKHEDKIHSSSGEFQYVLILPSKNTIFQIIENFLDMLEISLHLILPYHMSLEIDRDRDEDIRMVAEMRVQGRRKRRRPKKDGMTQCKMT